VQAPGQSPALHDEQDGIMSQLKPPKERGMPGFPTKGVGNPTNRGKTRRYMIQRMSSFFSMWAKSLSLVAREALRSAARAAAKQSA
jgi:hypothetical protein